MDGENKGAKKKEKAGWRPAVKDKTKSRVNEGMKDQSKGRKGDKKIKIVGARGRIENIESFIEKIGKIGDNKNSAIQVVDSDIVAGKSHLEHAAVKAIQSWEKDPISNSLSMEVLLFSTGERQIENALDKGGVKKKKGMGEECRKKGKEAKDDLGMAFVLIGNIGWSDVLDELDCEIEIDEEVLKYTPEKEKRVREVFGIGEKEVEAVGREKIPLIVLERVTLLELEK